MGDYTKIANSTNVEEIRDWIEEAPQANFIPTYSSVGRIESHWQTRTSKLKSRHTESKLTHTDRTSNEFDSIQDRSNKKILVEFKGRDGVIYPFTKLCEA